MEFKSGFVSIIGRPNVGKSTLINRLLGEKIVITSPRPQTTRNRIQAVYTAEEGQIIFIDTPGIHRARNELDKYMLEQARKSLEGIDLVVLMFDATAAYGPGDNYIVELLTGVETPALMVLNKIDRLDKKTLAARLEGYERKTGREVIPISAAVGENLEQMLAEIFDRLPEGPRYYPEEMITDQIEQFIIAEMIREKVFYLTREEVPYGVAVLIDEMVERDNGLFYIRATVYVEKKSHKGIIIGKNGSLLKQIGSRARNDIERLLDTDVYLDLWVKVLKDWREKDGLIKRMGYKG